jgi:hypothetical protein
MSARRKSPPSVQQAAEVRASFSGFNCGLCGAPARRTFSAEEVLELMEYIATKPYNVDIWPGAEKLERAARARLNEPEGCLFAPKSGVSICATFRRVR